MRAASGASNASPAHMSHSTRGGPSKPAVRLEDLESGKVPPDGVAKVCKKMPTLTSPLYLGHVFELAYPDPSPGVRGAQRGGAKRGTAVGLLSGPRRPGPRLAGRGCRRPLPRARRRPGRAAPGRLLRLRRVHQAVAGPGPGRQRGPSVLRAAALRHVRQLGGGGATAAAERRHAHAQAPAGGRPAHRQASHPVRRVAGGAVRPSGATPGRHGRAPRPGRLAVSRTHAQPQRPGARATPQPQPDPLRVPPALRRARGRGPRGGRLRAAAARGGRRPALRRARRGRMDAAAHFGGQGRRPERQGTFRTSTSLERRGTLAIR